MTHYDIFAAVFLALAAVASIVGCVLATVALIQSHRDDRHG